MILGVSELARSALKFLAGAAILGMGAPSVGLLELISQGGFGGKAQLFPTAVTLFCDGYLASMSLKKKVKQTKSSKQVLI